MSPSRTPTGRPSTSAPPPGGVDRRIDRLLERRKRAPRLRCWIERLLWTSAAACLAFVGATLFEAQWTDAEAARRLDAHRRSAVDVPAAERARPKAGELVGRISVARLGLSATILEGTGDGVLRRAVGHFRDTPLPGEPGNAALAGHRDTFFRSLARIRRGDRIAIETLWGDHRYRVVDTRIVEPTATEVLDRRSSAPSLTLVTCYPFAYVGPAPQRFVVHARALGRRRGEVRGVEARPGRGRASLRLSSASATARPSPCGSCA